MFTHRMDPAHAAVVWLFSGSTNDDGDFQRYVDTFDGLVADLGHHPKPVGVVYVERDNPMPEAKWRRRIADASTSLPFRPAIAFASPSTLIRGIVMMVNFFRPPPYDFTVEHSFEDAVRWLEEQRGESLQVLFALLSACQEEARSLTSGGA